MLHSVTAAPSLNTGRALRSLQVGMWSAKRRRGGLDRYFFDLIRALPDCGVAVQALVVGDPGDLNAGETATCFAPDSASLFHRWRKARQVIREQAKDSDLLVSHFAPYVLPVLDQLRKRPLVMHFHGPWSLEAAAEGGGSVSVAAKRVLERLVYRQASRFVVLSRAFADILKCEFGADEEKIRVVPGGVDLARFRTTRTRSEAKKILGWPTDRPIVLTVRRLVHAKGVENLIEAVKAVREEIPDVLVVIAGTGPLGPELKRRVAELGLDDYVRFTGFVPEEQLPTLYRAGDLFVVPTVALEGFGLVVVEALACGTPVLVTPVAGLPEVIADLDPGLIMEGARPQDLAHGITRALSGRLPLPSDERCIAYAERFEWSKIASLVAGVYGEVT